MFALGGTVFPQMLDGCLTVQIGSSLGHLSFAQAVTAVIKNKDIHFQFVVQQFDIFQPVADVTGVTMEPKQGYLCLTVRHEPAMKTNLVRGDEKDVIEGEPEVPRRPVDASL